MKEYTSNSYIIVIASKSYKNYTTPWLGYFKPSKIKTVITWDENLKHISTCPSTDRTDT